MNSKSLLLVAASSLLFGGCAIQPRAAAPSPAPAPPVAAAPAPAPAPAPTKVETSKNGRQKGTSAAIDALDYAAVKRASKRGYDGMTAIHNKTVRLDAKNMDKHGYFTMKRSDNIFFNCETRAPGFKPGPMTGTISTSEFFDDGSKAHAIGLANCAPA
ncbi:hypothetical protein QTH90_27400 [Variovorax sp. J2P1-59]|uniref:hypothetical protein n=1 Tax=Variovorax flavidus TaxID=3053501 RepID=UPI002577CAE9|nr:hypothetical protein [Variovorax sp. J2P1-59]MDM0078164.1 hypothetical protein [Variovorax sp. J2P1-59]